VVRADCCADEDLLLSAGYTFDTRFQDPCLWTDSFPPSTLLEPVLPDEDTDPADVGFREIDVTALEVVLPEIP
jgi:hypothetical protein